MMVKRVCCATSLLLLLVICAGCDGVPTALCLNFESGCSGQSGGIPPQAWQIYVAGFPLDRVDQTPIAGTDGYRGTLEVGDTVSFRLYHVLSDRVSAAGATELPVRTWALTDSHVATLSREADGAARVVAIGVGKLLPLVANDIPYGEV
jgi:hypothetical protein